jgi:SNF2 family DNA or RNA helicase
MISKEAVKEFFDKPRDSFDWIKEASREELEVAIKELCPTFQYKTQLFTHQLAATYLGLCFDGFLYFLDMGTGKSRISLTVVQIRKQLKKVKRTLILVPNLVNIESWLEEIKIATNLTAVGLVGTKEERLQLIQQKVDLYVLNYDGLPIFTTDFKEVGKGAKAKRKRTINPKALRSFATMFDMIVFDEVHHLKHTNTLTFQICRGLSDHAKYRIGMTGTPVGRDPQNFWSQFYICDHGETLGTNKTVFLQALFKQQAGYWGGVQWIFPEKNRPILQKMLLHRSLRYADHECGDLPPLSVIKVPLSLHPDAAKMYRNLVMESIEQAKGNSQEAKTKRKNYYAKTRQVASGFLYDSDEDENKVTLTFNNPKLDALEEILEDVPADSKVVIFHVFNQSGISIGKKLKEMKIKYASMNVEAEGSKTEEYKKFKTDKKTKVLVVNIASGGEGLNLQDANYCIMYEPTDNPAVFRQALKRTHRIGQTKHTYIYQFLMNNTVEKKIFEFLEEGKSLFSAVVDGSIHLKEALNG